METRCVGPRKAFHRQNNHSMEGRFMKFRHCLLIALAFLMASCLGTPDGIEAADRIQPLKYAGTWYEIARLDHSFERGLQRVTAEYRPRDDGGLDVINRGYDVREKVWQEAEGKAYFLDPANADGTYKGKLKVSFFGPFYGAYNIIAFDRTDYRYALVCGEDRSSFWILSRTPQLPPALLSELVAQAEALGFATEKLVYVEQ